jgi:hypothetical protein
MYELKHAGIIGQPKSVEQSTIQKIDTMDDDTKKREKKPVKKLNRVNKIGINEISYLPGDIA